MQLMNAAVHAATGGAGALQVAVYVGAGEFQVGDVPTRPPRRSYHYIWWPRRGGREPRRRTGGTLAARECRPSARYPCRHPKVMPVRDHTMILPLNL